MTEDKIKVSDAQTKLMRKHLLDFSELLLSHLYCLDRLTQAHICSSRKGGDRNMIKDLIKEYEKSLLYKSLKMTEVLR